MVEVDRVYLIAGKVRTENGDRAQIIVERIQNDLTVARPADPSSEHEVRQPEAREGTPPPAQPREPIEPVSRAASAELDLDRPSGLAVESGPAGGERQAGALPAEADRAPSTSGGAPPPPPNFDPDDDTLYRPASSTTASPTDPPAKRSTSATPETIEARAENLAPAVVPDTPASPRVIDIRIRPDKAWQETCREVVKLAGRYEGADALRISVSGRPMTMEFPNIKTHFCPEFVEEVDGLTAIVGVNIA